jgi:hypothetical protein
LSSLSSTRSLRIPMFLILFFRDVGQSVIVWCDIW